MRTDMNGCSTTANGQEQWEDFISSFDNQLRVQYDYRTTEGKLFSCVAKTLEAARKRRDKWLEEQKS